VIGVKTDRVRCPVARLSGRGAGGDPGADAGEEAVRDLMSAQRISLMTDPYRHRLEIPAPHDGSRGGGAWKLKQAVVDVAAFDRTGNAGRNNVHHYRANARCRDGELGRESEADRDHYWS